jgi:hypothetical protein
MGPGMTTDYKSEYFGIRIAMHDALQRYYAADTAGLSDSDKIALLQVVIQAACNDNGLFAPERKEVVGRSWAQFIASRPPEAILQFISNPEVVAFSKMHGQPLQSKVGNLSLIDTGAILYEDRNFGFEKVAQTTGLIDYKAGDDLSTNLKKAEMELRTNGLAGPEAPEESALNKVVIRTLFDSAYGKVKAEHLGPISPRINAAGDGKDAGRS